MKYAERWTPHARAQMDTVLARYEREFKEDGNVQGLADAVAFCGWNGLVLPEWCVAPVVEALDLYNRRSGRGRGQSPGAKFANAEMHKQRHAMVDFARIFPGPNGKIPTLDEACEDVANRLGKSQSVTARTVKESYNRIERTRK